MSLRFHADFLRCPSPGFHSWLNAALMVLTVAGAALAVAGPQDVATGPAPLETQTASAGPARSLQELQQRAIEADAAEFGHWGTNPAQYTGWKSHSNRLIPVFTYGTRGAGEGIDLNSYIGERSLYRSGTRVTELYGYLPERTVDPAADWMDQTSIADIQRAAARAGRKHIFLVVFDGMDWQTLQAAAICNLRRVAYRQGRGTGTHLQDYMAGGSSQFGYMVTSPHNEGSDVDVNSQTVTNPGGKIRGGYSAACGGRTPWDTPADPGYLIGKPADGNPKHAYTDSSSSASSMTTGIKTFNGGINVDPAGHPVPTIAHELQEQGWRVGAVSSVPISHATPAAAYAHNVSRDDYQDLTRDMLGLPSVAHPNVPLPGMDVVIGGGFGNVGDPENAGRNQGMNYVPGNVYLTDADRKIVDVRHGGRYVVVERTAGQTGTDLLMAAARSARLGGHRLLGFFGMGAYGGHLPFATADGRFDPVRGNSKKPERYTEADLMENPTLAGMTMAALEVLGSDDRPFWLMVESGDVDWANHDNNIDNSVGAVNSGDAAVKVITDWVEAHSDWNESLLIVTADHGHLLFLDRPEILVEVCP